MDLPFTDRPGRRERHLRRRHENPLFGWPAPEVEPAALLAAQRADHEELEAFATALHALVRRAVDLPPETGSDEILTLKEDLERHYEQACGLAGDHAAEKTGIARLIEVIMGVVRGHAGSDPLATQELAQEEAARVHHFRLLELPLVVDLLHPESPVAPEELAATVLSASDAEFAALPELFDGSELALLVEQAEARLTELADVGFDLAGARARLAALQTLSAAADGSGATG
ncbi:hypothetical protein Thimo_0136 [Thioflavicoccus mobilis 8321]|uniref:Uncharacterized protein n=1 Tax=Thioflavicoccus mobilis 8321 TaxID=765912 RepID=L0GSR2_9GAMM|nr:hypothetical protein [Thioflavicoccus mobilis]AGA89011.1 hypothetical protein Thimo_0136 [Thioflavicoccus mobilis 8321]